MKMAELIYSIQSAEIDGGSKKPSKPKFYLADTISRGGKKYLVSTISVPSFLQDMGDGKFETGVFLLDDDGKINPIQLFKQFYETKRGALSGHKRAQKDFDPNMRSS
jgi:hypothetical protein